MPGRHFQVMIPDPVTELIKNVSNDPGPYNGVNKECK